MVTIGIIGAGIMGERMLRAAQEQASDFVQVTGIWDPSAEALSRIGALAPHAHSVPALIAAAQCVYVASPPASHLEYARASLEAGKAVFCEKPLAVDMSTARAFVEAVGGGRVAVNFPMASSPAVAKLADWLSTGVVGTQLRLEIEVGFADWPRSWQRDAAGWLDRRAQGGFTREVVSHFLFLTRRLCGAMVLQAGRARFDSPDTSERAIAAQLTAGGLPATLTGGVGTTLKDDHNTWTLWGDRGAIRLRDWSIAERLVDGVWVPDQAAMPNERMRSLVLRRQLEGVERMTLGDTHHLATVQEAFEVQTVVEGVLEGWVRE
ncbi:Gfo/Idh/MocA family protein [Caenimonas sp. SL110]|uniref:Gfo/Idh/MocA family protein n=1 Tax=Caenimonas sp. SL110 TaxID=1450524 RepID=UPI000AC92749|nr:Gfo/Idh/MocA family oxidoreductase [Caenimonas sp. SL110]